MADLPKRSLLSRKKDLLYLVFFCLHVPIIFLNDTLPLVPESYRPAVLVQNQAAYVAKFDDRFFINPPSWFTAYTWMELLYHTPASILAIKALWNDDVKIPLHLLVFGLQAAVTTFTCIAEYLSWENFTVEQKTNLGMLYGPYLALAVFMTVDMLGRLNATLDRAAGLEKGKKAR